MSANVTHTETNLTEFDRLDPRNLEASARWLLEHNADPVALVVSLLKTVRQNDDTQQAIRDGCHFSSRCREEMHKAEIDAVHLGIARSIEREARRGNQGAAPNQQLTYAGGLRRAARIARGWRTTRDLAQRAGA